jgi:hypothetical protein
LCLFIDQIKKKLVISTEAMDSFIVHRVVKRPPRSAFEVAFLVVIPEGDLLLHFAFVIAYFACHSTAQRRNLVSQRRHIFKPR